MEKINQYLEYLTEEYGGAEWRVTGQDEKFVYVQMVGWVNEYRIDLSDNKMYAKSNYADSGWNFELTVLEEYWLQDDFI